MQCLFCKRQITNKGSLKAHEMSCNENPDKIKHKRSIFAGRKKGDTAWNKGKKISPSKNWIEKLPNNVLFVEDCKHARGIVKRRILQQKIKEYKCNICNQEPFWNGKPMPLILDHINGVNNDNRLDNLRFICSNCDSQLETYKSRNRRVASKVLKES